MEETLKKILDKLNSLEEDVRILKSMAMENGLAMRKNLKNSDAQIIAQINKLGEEVKRNIRAK